MNKLKIYAMALGMFLFAQSGALADDINGQGQYSGTGQATGTGITRGQGEASGTGVAVYRDQNGNIRTKRGQGSVSGRGMVLGRGSIEGRGRGMGRGRANGAGHFRKGLFHRRH